ncbi:hypothetical protein ACWIB8_05330 [Corynebacterium flavescens]
MSSNPFPNPPTQEFPSARKPARWKKILAWVAAVFGIILILSAVFAQDGARTAISVVLFGAAIALPGAWFLLHERRAKSNSGAPLNRHWKGIAAAAVALFVSSGIIAPKTEAPADPAPVVTESSTTAAPTTSSKTSTSKPSPTSSSAEPTTSAEPAVEPEPAPEENADNQQHGFVAPQQQPEPEAPAPAPVVEQQAPAPAPAPDPAPVYEAPAPAAPAAGTVHPGSFCSGGTGVSKKGVPMVCAPGSDGRNRWQSA